MEIISIIKYKCFFECGASDAPSTATNFSGIGLQSGGAMRYQVTTATNTHTDSSVELHNLFLLLMGQVLVVPMLDGKVMFKISQMD